MMKIKYLFGLTIIFVIFVLGVSSVSAECPAGTLGTTCTDVTVVVADVVTPPATLSLTGTDFQKWVLPERSATWENVNVSGTMVTYMQAPYKLNWSSTNTASCKLDTISKPTSGEKNDYEAWSGTYGVNWGKVHTLSCVGNDGLTYTKTLLVSIPPMPKLPASGSCSADGKTGTFSWTPPSGYSTFLTRAYDKTTYPSGSPSIYSVNNDNNNSTSQSFDTLPGHSYAWRVHTKSLSNNAWSFELSGSFDCPIPSVPSGSISATNCGIAIGQSSCDITLNWNTLNPVVGLTSEVTTGRAYNSDTPISTVVRPLNTGTNIPWKVYYTGPTTPQRFYLYHNGVELANTNVNVIANCVAPGVWDPTAKKCVAPVGPSGSISATDCKIAIGQSSCDITLNWNTLNPVVGLTSEVTTGRAYNSNTPISTIVRTLNTGTNIPWKVYYTGPTTPQRFYLYHNGVELANTNVNVIANCVAPGVWDPTAQKCVAVPSVNYKITTNVNPGGAGYFLTGDPYSNNLSSRDCSAGCPVPEDSDFAVDAKANSGYTFSYLKVDGIDKYASRYDFYNIKKDHGVIAYFVSNVTPPDPWVSLTAISPVKKGQSTTLYLAKNDLSSCGNITNNKSLSPISVSAADGTSSHLTAPLEETTTFYITCTGKDNNTYNSEFTVKVKGIFGWLEF